MTNQQTQTGANQRAVLVLEDGFYLLGRAYGAVGTAQGEVVFSTAMTGYQETLTDPSYHRQIVVQTAPHIGNTGINEEDPESKQIWVAGYVVRDPARRTSSWRATKDLEDELLDQGIVGISHVDTRALTLHIREKGAMAGAIFSGAVLPPGVGINGQGLDEETLSDLVRLVKAQPAMTGARLTGEVTTTDPYVVGPDASFKGQAVAKVAAIDLGIKARTPEHLAALGVEVHVLPANATFAQIQELAVDGVFFSNGPGDPATATDQIALLRQVLRAGLPFFGICFGNQLLGRALGFDTYKLAYGHRGVNQPVLDRRSGKVEITAHNHGFAVDIPLDRAVEAPFNGGEFGRVEVSHVALNDQVVEGITALDRPAFAVQYHPEAAAGPHDAAYLFTEFVDMMRAYRAGKA